MPNSSTSFRSSAHTMLTVIVLSFFLLLMLLAMLLFAGNELVKGLVVMFIPLVVIAVIIMLVKPRFGIIAILFANYFAIGMSRYMGLPFGLMVDGFMIITLLSVFFMQLHTKVEWKNAKRDVTYLVLFWMFITTLQLVNPETISRAAWMYAMRSMALYSALIVPLVYWTYNKPSDMMTFIHITGWFTLLGILKGIQQKFIGPDPWEQAWLEVPGNQTTHVLFGVLRVFSFFADAGTYGGMMAYFGVFYIILAIHLKISTKAKVFFWIIGLGSLYGMAISGTRSAVATPLVGFFFYAFLTKNFKAMIITGIFLLFAVVILKYTNIGQGYYEIRRMRTAFQDDDASLQVRKENRALFSKYLETRPFGGGVGSAGNWGLRFTPGTFLAQTPTDGWYIQVWVEQGIVGLVIYLFMIGYLVAKSTYLILFKIHDKNFRYVAIASLASAMGMIVSSYSSSSLGQLPGTILFFMTMCFISLMPDWEKNHLTT